MWALNTCHCHFQRDAEFCFCFVLHKSQSVTTIFHKCIKHQNTLALNGIYHELSKPWFFLAARTVTWPRQTKFLFCWGMKKKIVWNRGDKIWWHNFTTELRFSLLEANLCNSGVFIVHIPTYGHGVFIMHIPTYGHESKQLSSYISTWAVCCSFKYF